MSSGTPPPPRAIGRDPPATVFLRGSPLDPAGADACRELLAAFEPAELSVLSAGAAEPEAWLRAWRGILGERPAELCVLTGEAVRHAAAPDAGAVMNGGDVVIRSLPELDDRAALGEAIVEFLAEHRGADRQPVVCIEEPVAAPGDDVGTPPVRFLDLVGGAVRRTGALGVFPVDPEAVGPETAGTLRRVVDHVIEPEEGCSP